MWAEAAIAQAAAAAPALDIYRHDCCSTDALSARAETVAVNGYTVKEFKNYGKAGLAADGC